MVYVERHRHTGDVPLVQELLSVDKEPSRSRQEESKHLERHDHRLRHPEKIPFQRREYYKVY